MSIKWTLSLSLFLASHSRCAPMGGSRRRASRTDGQLGGLDKAQSRSSAPKLLQRGQRKGLSSKFRRGQPIIMPPMACCGRVGSGRASERVYIYLRRRGDQITFARAAERAGERAGELFIGPNCWAGSISYSPPLGDARGPINGRLGGPAALAIISSLASPLCCGAERANKEASTRGAGQQSASERASNCLSASALDTRTLHAQPNTGQACGRPNQRAKQARS